MRRAANTRLVTVRTDQGTDARQGGTEFRGRASERSDKGATSPSDRAWVSDQRKNAMRMSPTESEVPTIAITALKVVAANVSSSRLSMSRSKRSSDASRRSPIDVLCCPPLSCWRAPGRLSGVRSTRDTLREAARGKQAVRERVWALLERRGAARFPGARGRIPNFVGAEVAAARLAELPVWKRARVVKANPDAPQLPVRARALAEGKLVYMAVPRLVERKPFMLLNPDRLKMSPRRAASIRGAAAAGRKIAIEEMQPVDLVVCGSVAVNKKGVRVGKGGGFSDLEFALLVEAGLITDETALATTVHPLQVLEEELPETDHDFRVGRIVTPDEVIVCRRTRKS